jgi:flagellar protein FliS
VNGTAAQRAYTEAGVLTASPEQLVLMLYDGAIRFLNQGAAALRGGQTALGRERVRRADAIISELNSTLDMTRGEVPERLRSIYLFCRRQLLDATIHGRPDQVDVVIKLLAELREAWQGAVALV